MSVPLWFQSTMSTVSSLGQLLGLGSCFLSGKAVFDGRLNYISISLYLYISISLYLYIFISLYLYISISLYLYISIARRHRTFNSNPDPHYQALQGDIRTSEEVLEGF